MLSAGTARLHSGLETMVAWRTADDTAALRCENHWRQRHTPPIRSNRKAYIRCGGNNQLRWRRPGRRTYPAMGDEKSRCAMSGKATVDFVAHRRGNPRGVQQTRATIRLRPAFLCRSVARNRRLDSGHECHTPLHT